MRSHDPTHKAKDSKLPQISLASFFHASHYVTPAPNLRLSGLHWSLRNRNRLLAASSHTHTHRSYIVYFSVHGTKFHSADTMGPKLCYHATVHLSSCPMEIAIILHFDKGYIWHCCIAWCQRNAHLGPPGWSQKEGNTSLLARSVHNMVSADCLPSVCSYLSIYFMSVEATVYLFTAPCNIVNWFGKERTSVYMDVPFSFT